MSSQNNWWSYIYLYYVKIRRKKIVLRSAHSAVSKVQALNFPALLKKIDIEMEIMEKQTVAWVLVHGEQPSQVLNSSGHEVVSGKLSKINQWKSIRSLITLFQRHRCAWRLLLRPIWKQLWTAWMLSFVVPTGVTRLALNKSLKHWITLSQSCTLLRARTCFDQYKSRRWYFSSRSEVVVVSGPSHAEETIVRDITLISSFKKI